MESSKLKNVAMHFTKIASYWWSSLRTHGMAPKTWKDLSIAIMKQFLAINTKIKVLIKWQSLNMVPYESIHRYTEKFWELHLKASIYQRILFEEQKQQFCANITEEMSEYVKSQ